LLVAACQLVRATARRAALRGAMVAGVCACDVVVVGAGLSGLVCAAALQQAPPLPPQQQQGVRPAPRLEHQQEQQQQRQEEEQEQQQQQRSECHDHEVEQQGQGQCWERHRGLRVVVLEQDDRFGGRLLSRGGLDLGAAWSWPAHDRALGALMRTLGVTQTIAQSAPGDSVVQGRDGRFRAVDGDLSPSGPGSVRIEGGAEQLCAELVRQHGLDVRLGSAVVAVEQRGAAVRVSAAGGQAFEARAVVVAVPPRAAARIAFSPALAPQRLAAMRGTPTWMGDAGKLVLRFDRPFWRERGLSGSVLSQRGPVQQAWDSSDRGGAALAAFVCGPHRALLHQLEQQARQGQAPPRSPILDQLEQALGAQVRSFSSLHAKSWAALDAAKADERDEDDEEQEGGSSSSSSGGRYAPATEYGDRALAEPHGVVLFAGTETTPGESGHMEGAVLAGQRAARQAAAALAAKGSAAFPPARAQRLTG
jgi:monoamine oxidase